MAIGWLTAFLDLPTRSHRAGVDFWSAVTATTPSPTRGDRGQFSTARPAAGEAFLRFQDITEAPARVHLDLHVVDVDAAADRAVTLDAIERPSPSEVRIHTSPGGLTYCFVPIAEAGDRPPANRWRGPLGAYTSELDQVCLDIEPRCYDQEVAFWSALTGWPRQPSADSLEFSWLVRPDPLPLRLLLQRLHDDTGSGDDAGAVSAHLDLASTDPVAEVDRHLALGARFEYAGRGWQTLTDPTGLRYCITARTPH